MANKFDKPNLEQFYNSNQRTKKAPRSTAPQKEKKKESISLSVRIPKEIYDKMQVFKVQQDFPPSTSQIVIKALEKFLKDSRNEN